MFLFLFQCIQFYIFFAEALKLVISECKPKAKIVDICEKGDSFIRE
jgi:methionine aminopeptidase